MQIGYLPDSFGHPSQMPQILSGVGLQEMVFWRGLDPDVDTCQFVWEGFDGTQILGINMHELRRGSIASTGSGSIPQKGREEGRGARADVGERGNPSHERGGSHCAGA